MADAEEKQIRTTIILAKSRYPELYAAMENISERQRSGRYRALADKGLLVERYHLGSTATDYIEWRINRGTPDLLARFLKDIPPEERISRLWQLAHTGLFMEGNDWKGPAPEPIISPAPAVTQEDENEAAAMDDIAGICGQS